jgi:hypothetical protein
MRNKVVSRLRFGRTLLVACKHLYQQDAWTSGRPTARRSVSASYPGPAVDADHTRPTRSNDGICRGARRRVAASVRLFDPTVGTD